MSTPAPSLTPEQLEAFGQELDAIRARVVADLGERDADYINKVIRTQRGLEVAGRALLLLGFLPPAWIGGTAALSLSKILDNMEIGHNVMHGQYDWMKDPRLNGKTFEWDTACPGDQWRHSHNYMHHTHTNIVGKDRDIGYGILRMSEEERWHPYYLGNPLYAALLAIFFQYGVALHDLEAERLAAGETTLAEKRGMLGDIWRKVRGQTLKDYLLFPLLSGPSLPFVLAGDASANLARNLWSFTIIFCGHFPDGTQQFTEEQAENETRGEWYYRQPARLGQPDWRQAVPHPRGQPQLPDRAPPVSGSSRSPLRRDIDRGQRDHGALPHPLQHRPAAQAVRQRRAKDRQARAATAPRPRQLRAQPRGGRQGAGTGANRSGVTSCCSGDALEQVARRGQLEAAGEDHDRLQPGRALAALEQADLRAVQVAEVGQRLLGEARPIAVLSEVGGKLPTDSFHRSNSRAAQTKVPQTTVFDSSLSVSPRFPQIATCQSGFCRRLRRE